MSRLRVHCFTISLDGYGAGPNQSLDNPLGEGGEDLHNWMFGTRRWGEMVGTEGGTEGIDNDFVAKGDDGIGATIMGRNMLDPSGVRGVTRNGPAGGAPTLPITTRSSCLPITNVRRSRWKVAPLSTS